jgi:acetyltransferase-like isoleucine patch superfamily enzyme
MSEQADSHYSRAVIRGRRRRRLLNQILTLLGFHAPGFGARIWLNRKKGAQIGEDCWIGDYVTLDIHYAHPNRETSLILEDRVSVGPGAKLFTHDTAFVHISRGKLPIRFGQVKVGHDTWIGPHSVIANCKIGHHCIITPNSVVTTDIPDYSLVRGNPGVVVVDLRRVLQRMGIPTED